MQCIRGEEPNAEKSEAGNETSWYKLVPLTSCDHRGGWVKTCDTKSLRCFWYISHQHGPSRQVDGTSTSISTRCERDPVMREQRMEGLSMATDLQLLNHPARRRRYCTYPLEQQRKQSPRPDHLDLPRRLPFVRVLDARLPVCATVYGFPTFGFGSIDRTPPGQGTRRGHHLGVQIHPRGVGHLRLVRRAGG